MLFWIKCPSCSTPVKNFESYVNELENIFNNKSIKAEEKERLRGKLLDKYGYLNICCRIRIIGFVPFYKIIT